MAWPGPRACFSSGLLCGHCSHSFTSPAGVSHHSFLGSPSSKNALTSFIASHASSIHNMVFSSSHFHEVSGRQELTAWVPLLCFTGRNCDLGIGRPGQKVARGLDGPVAALERPAQKDEDLSLLGCPGLCEGGSSRD